MRGLRASGRLTKEHSGSASELHVSLGVSGGDRCDKRDHLGPRNAWAKECIAVNSNRHFSREPNPFEHSFGNLSLEAPANKSLLPAVGALISSAPLAGYFRVKGMGNPIHEYDNETRLVHFCLHLEIKDKLPQTFDKIGGTWYHKDPGDTGTLVPSTSTRMIPLPPGIPTMIWSYFYRQLATGGHQEGW